MRKPSIALAILLHISLLVLNGCAGAGSDRPRAVFLIVADTLRPDRLSCYGYDGHATPHIDALAGKGVRFTRAWSAASWTIPSMGSMMTSLYPTQLGLVELPAPPGKRFTWQELRDQTWLVISRDETTIAEIFQDAGFNTAAFVNQPGLIESGNYFQGFAEAYFPNGVGSVTRYDPATLEYPQWPPFLRHAWANDSALIDVFAEWLAGNRDRDLFVWLHLLTPHWPYDPPSEYMPGGEVAETDEQKLEERFYNGEVRAIDDLVGRITGAIDEQIGLDDSIVVFVSDHGEALGERGMNDHGHSLHVEVTRVPLILSAPSLPAQRTVEADARMIDLLPTVLELAGLEDVAPPDAEGASLIPAIEGDTPALPVFTEAMLYGSTERSLIRDGYKLMHDEQVPGHRLFDVVADPAEARDVAAQHPTRIERLRGELDLLHARLVVDRQRRVAGSDPKSPDERERMLEALRSLGYVR